jgi:peptidoglycan hydrolase-like protein with peptidoglycan-binding domain
MTLDELLVEAGAELDRLSAAHASTRSSGVRDATARRWARAAAALALVGTAVGVYALVRDPDTSISVVSVPPVPVTQPLTNATDVSSTSTTTGSTTTVVGENSPLTRPISMGSSGDDVAMVQQRLAELGYVVGPVDGAFGAEMQQAVWAFKKLVLGVSPAELDASRTATTVTPADWALMSEPISIVPRRPQGDGSTHVEIYLPQQVLVVFTGDVPTLVAHISSGQLDDAGEPREFCETATYDADELGNPLDPPVEKTICADSKTPGGVFRVTRTDEGRRVGPLGGMFKPVYFNYGIAVHGAQNVPMSRASHGTVRVNLVVADLFFTLVQQRDVVFVWGEDGREPELYTREESLPSFNRVGG